MQQSKVLSARPLPNPSAQANNATLGSAWGKVQAKTATEESFSTRWVLMCSECRGERYVVKYDKHTWQLACACKVMGMNRVR